MTAWTSDELELIGAADEIEIAPRRRNGALRSWVTIWVVRCGDDLYVRSYRGSAGAWYRAAQAHREGRVRAGNLERDVAFAAETDPDINDQIDAAYHVKYQRYPGYVSPMISPEARATTLKIVPQ